MNKKLKILLSAYACEPNRGSEPEVGWKWAVTLSKMGHEVHVVTRLNNKEVIENYLSKNKIPNLFFIYFDYPKWLLKLIKGKANAYSYFYFYIWQIGIYFAVKPFIKKIKFDFIHHVTFVSIRIPSFLCFYNVPFIFGPISGGDKIPIQLRKKFPYLLMIKEFIRDINNYFIKISPLINVVFLKSHKIYVTSEQTKKLIPLKFHNKTEQLLAIGSDHFLDKEFNFIEKRKFNICFAGNLIHIKGLSIVLKTIYKMNLSNIDLTIIGTGNIESELKEKAIKYKINHQIKWLGQINRYDLIQEFKKSNLLLIPALRDSGGLVILEAMSVGVPVATLNIGGPGIIVNNDCGILVNVKNKNEDEIAEEFSMLINDLIINKDKLKYKKIKSLERSKEFSWDKKILTIYNN
jgi:glycosyltransferase involved in cell wall biosynthesis